MSDREEDRETATHAQYRTSPWELAGFALGVAAGADGVVTTAVCGGETARRKPHPEPLLTALGKLAVPPAECAYVGDSPEDVAMARAAGALAVGIPGGFPNREALRAASPDLLLPSLDEAVEALLG